MEDSAHKVEEEDKILSDTNARPSKAREDQSSSEGQQRDNEEGEMNGEDEHDGGNDVLDYEQKQLDIQFAERRQLPPVRAGIMILLTVGKLLPLA